MAAPTEAEVRELFIGDTEASSSAVEFYANLADDIVQEHVPTGDYTQDVIDRATRLVAAHALTATDPTARSESIGDASASYERPESTPDDLGETRFGRRAQALIPELANVGGSATSAAAFHGSMGD